MNIEREQIDWLVKEINDIIPLEADQKDELTALLIDRLAGLIALDLPEYITYKIRSQIKQFIITHLTYP